MQRFEVESLALLPGQRVQAKVLSHEPWGLMTSIEGYEHLGSSIDLFQQGAPPPSHEQWPELYPVGSAIDAVVMRISREHAPAWVRLSIRPEELQAFRVMCDFCLKSTILSPGGDGLVLDIRSNDGAGATTVIAHRECLVERVSPGSVGQQARIRKVGRP
ncbi:hypothetical protein EDD29_8231 [Actinocorallia herbida]|uniref:Uncharacterized protein n=1 Tax=Actinocorallia herbida TaxID=58109 RepID=A0A3N1DAD9_9ACTN|nr:hypothetical protein EDD29_8231 [Actinocorallia herbida]